MASVRPLHGASLPVPVATPIDSPAAARPIAVRAAAKPRTPPPPRPGPGETLDGSWDRKLAHGVVAPDSIVDLHGLGLQAAYELLDTQLGAAIARGDRVLLLVTGRPPRTGSERPHVRGAIRAAVGDWLAASRHARAIAAVRVAHPRHGGVGALYLILRRSGRAASSNF
ncbi:Smr/MutS family protein [Hephaestia sp. GCM10023244]|uniref:Smr/MutS family protein n=1 Tax=unclassified Hephaestia TaxID=2631281 RepID=UPI002076EDE1|nr:Smr/MutS family protein [Hephaestia sp. MAHUQ-44]MCM8729961.1 Smr/MutS family protein [Hephaestia sp. MAHUQ-44]